jgi:hypothetical protein
MSVGLREMIGKVLLWFREVAGWILLGFGVAAFAGVYMFLLNRWFLEGGIFAFCGFMLLRTGMHLLKVASAARAAHEVRSELAGAKAKIRPNRSAMNQSINGRPRPSVLPGPAKK